MTGLRKAGPSANLKEVRTDRSLETSRARRPRRRSLRRFWTGLAGCLTLATVGFKAPDAWALKTRGSSTSSTGPYTRLLPAPIVFPAYHETVRDNPAVLRIDQALSFQTLASPSFSGGPHGIDAGAAYSNGTFGIGLLAETFVGPVSRLEDLTLGFSAGTGAFSGGLSVSLNPFTFFSPRFTIGALIGSGEGSHFGIALYDLGTSLLNATLRLGYGHLMTGAFNFEFFVETPPFATISNNFFRIGAASVVSIEAWTLGFLASYGLSPGAGFTPGGSPGSGGIAFEMGVSKWLSALFNLQLRISSHRSATLGLTFAWASP